MIATLLTALLLGSSVLASALVSPEEPADVRAEERPEWTRDEVKTALATYKVSAKGASSKQQIDALLKLAEGRHPDVVKELKKYVKSKDRNLRLAALRLLGTQRGDAAARKALLPFLKIGKRLDTKMATEAARSLGYVGYEKKGHELLVALFYAKRQPEIRQAIVQAFGNSLDKQAASLLIRLLDAPMPDDASSASNPPVSYWADRHKEWLVFRDDAKDAVGALTGERFHATRAAVEWVEEHGKEADIEYARPKSPWI